MIEHITRQTETIAGLAERIGRADRRTLAPVEAARLVLDLEEVRAKLARLADMTPSTTTRSDNSGPLFR